MNYSPEFVNELNQAVAAELAPYEGREIRHSDLEDITDALNVAARIVYANHGYEYPNDFTVESTYKLIQVLSFISGLVDEFEAEEANPTAAHDERLIDNMDRYDPAANDEDDIPDLREFTYGENPSMPVNWQELMSSMDAELWTRSFFETVSRHPEILNDVGTIHGWFANAIMAGFDNALWIEYPTQELADNEFVYLEFYNYADTENTDSREKAVVVTFKFPTLNAAQMFVQNNGATVDASFYRMYTLEETTTFTQRDIT